MTILLAEYHLLTSIELISSSETPPSLLNSKHNLKSINNVMKFLRLKNILIYQFRNSTPIQTLYMLPWDPPFELQDNSVSLGGSTSEFLLFKVLNNFVQVFLPS